MKYIMLDKDDITLECGVITTEEILKEISKNELWTILYTPNNFFRDMFILVEDEETKKFYETKSRTYYADSGGNIYTITKKNGVKKTLVGYKKRGVRAINVGGTTFICKNLMAKLFIPEYKRNDVVLQKDGSYYNVAVDNLVIVPKEKHSKVTGAMSKSQKVGLFENGKLVKKWSSARRCAKDLFCSHATIDNYCNNTTKNKMFDVRWL